MNDYSLSSDEVMKIVGSKIPVVTSSEYHKYDNIDQLLEGGDKVLLLYEDSRRPNAISGHWTCLYKFAPTELAFVDSYGEMPDSQLHHIPEQYRLQHNMMHRWLADMMVDSQYNLHYNPYELQGDTTQTCGRWAGLALREQLDPEDFVDDILDQAAQYGYTKPKQLDKLIIQLTDRFL